MKSKIKSFEGACKALKIKPSLPNVSGLPKKHRDALTAHYKLIIIAEALNDGWKPNWGDSSEYKYYSWFYFDKTGFRFHGADCGYANTFIGSRLVFKTRELSDYAAKQFLGLYKKYMV